MSKARLIIVGVCLACLATKAQNQTIESSSQQSPDTRTYSIYFGIGFLEAVALGVQYQINDHFAVGAKFSAYYLSGRGYIVPPSGGGGGIKLSYYFDRVGGNKVLLRANVVNFEASYLVPHINKSSDRSYYGAGIEITVGHDAIKDKGLGFLWAVGGSFSAATSLVPSFFPALKLGLHFDL